MKEKLNLIMTVLLCVLVIILSVALFIPEKNETKLFVKNERAEEEPQKGTISITARSEIKVQPDMAKFSISASSVRTTTEEASKATAEIINNALNILCGKFGIPSSEIETGYKSVGPYYEYVDGNRKLQGQQATDSINVIVHDIDSLGLILDNLALIDGISISSVTLDREDKSEYSEKARVEAGKIALKKAESYAAGLGVKVGAVLAVSDGTQSVNNPSLQYKVANVRLSATTPESEVSNGASYYVGDITISDSISVTFELIQ